jgi:hypothetical protein
MASGSSDQPQFAGPVPCCTNCRIPFDFNTPSRAFAAGGHLLAVCPLCYALGYAGSLLSQPGFTILPEDRALLLAHLDEVVRYLQHLTDLSEQARLALVHSSVIRRRRAAARPGLEVSSDSDSGDEPEG